MRQVRCDIRYVSLVDLRDRWGGGFDVVLSDPPLRIRGGDEGPEQGSMLSNALYSHKYRTMSLVEHADLNLEVLSSRGFFFLWSLKSLEDYARRCLRKYGYQYLRTMGEDASKSGKVHNGHGYYFQHAHEILLVGCKGDVNEQVVSFLTKVSSDAIFGAAHEASAKPSAVHEFIEEAFPSSRKLELFARSTRPGWYSLGDQLSLWAQCYSCDFCETEIEVTEVRWKKKVGETKDLCNSCFVRQKCSEEDYFQIENAEDAEDAVLHEYTSCDCCKVESIQGVRFSCSECPDFDLCEGCFDERDELHSIGVTKHPPSHAFRAVNEYHPPFPSMKGTDAQPAASAR
eukprot:CAMPEP_0113901962 /NCGR_PEP_ID=MMETSP0780_2-20120614/21563_1 /TAXON_ID=652834 /ORGANISM="Palpitomonas bilix" /LENGTH=342 /DNA_ID=CAMNT_0000894669 /DNA_START=20 /DNA_END=1050 /DNA_ORIENTATION=+ /assembly_acc=CAM_ASM_000599